MTGSRGRIVQRSRGSWSIVLDVGKGPDGKRKQQRVTVKGPKAQAQAKLTEMLHQLDTGSYVRPTKLTLDGFLEQWQRDYVSTSTRPRTAEGYSVIIKRHLAPKLGHVALTDLRPAHLQAYYREALERGAR